MTDYLEEARIALREADPLCSEANLLLTESKKNIEQTVVYWARTMFLAKCLDAQKDKIQAYTKIMASIGRAADLDGKSRLNQLGNTREYLEKLLDTLKEVPATGVVPSSDAHTTLHSYVHTEGIFELTSKVESLSESFGLTLSQIRTFAEQPRTGIKSLLGHMPSISAQENELPEKLVAVAQTGDQAAHRMAEMLTSFTKHYDLCNEMLMLEEAEAIQAAVDVISEDREHLAEGLETLRRNHKVLEGVYSSALGYKQDIMTLHASVKLDFERLDAFTSQTLRVATTQLMKVSETCAEEFKAIGFVEKELLALTGYYKQFLSSFEALKSEVERRRQAQDHMQRQVDKVNTVLATAYDQEMISRADFQEKHSGFLPTALKEVLKIPIRKYTISWTEEEC